MLYVKNQAELTQITELFPPITEKIPLPLVITRKVGNQNLRGVSSPEQEEKPAPSSIRGQWGVLFKGKGKQADRMSKSQHLRGRRHGLCAAFHLELRIV